MSEWWTYSLSDFLMFSSRTYWRLIALYNQDVWPGHIIAFIAGLALIGCLARPGVKARRIVLLLLAAAWGWTGWAYHLERYTEINTAGPYFAAAFILQALMLFVLGFRADDGTVTHTSRRAVLLISGLAVIAYPLVAPANGRSWITSEVFGIAPDPTVAATLGALLVLRAHWLAWLIPLAWCATSGATLMELRVGHAWLLPVVGMLTLATALFSRATTPSRILQR